MSFLASLRRRAEPLISIHVDAEQLRTNLRIFSERSGKQVAPVLKSNAYGHGLVEVAYALKDMQLPFLMIDSQFEAEVLRGKNIKVPLLVAGFVRSETIAASRLRDVSYVVGSLDQLRRLAQHVRRRTSVHLKIDTGMHRLGIGLGEIEEALSILRESGPLVLDGLMSHFSAAENDNEKTMRQIQMWNAIVAECKDVCDPVRYLHISATAGHRFLSEAAANATRLGLGLYGILPEPSMQADFPVRPALSMTTLLASVRRIKAGDSVGYGNAFRAPEDMTIGIIPVGYFEGLDRRLSNKGSVRIGGTSCPIIGSISMNMAAIDLSAIAEPAIGMEVEIFSADPEAVNSIENLSRLSGMIPYELLVHIPQHLKRKY
jgi:alanine racemase